MEGFCLHGSEYWLSELDRQQSVGPGPGLKYLDPTGSSQRAELHVGHFRAQWGLVYIMFDFDRSVKCGHTSNQTLFLLDSWLRASGLMTGSFSHFLKTVEGPRDRKFCRFTKWGTM